MRCPWLPCTQFSYEFFVHSDTPVPRGRALDERPSVDSHGKFSVREADPLGGPLPDLASPEARPEMHNTIKQAKGGFMRKAKDAITP